MVEVKIIKTVVSNELIEDAFKKDTPHRKIIEGRLPKDASLRFVQINPRNNTVELFFQSETEGEEKQAGESILTVKERAVTYKETTK